MWQILEEQLVTYDTFVFLYPHTAYLQDLEATLLGHRPDVDLAAIRGLFERTIYKLRRDSERTVFLGIYTPEDKLNELSILVRPTYGDIIIGVDTKGYGLQAPVGGADYETIADAIPGKRVALAGFHFCDCVFKLGLYLFEKGCQVDVALFATDFLFDYFTLPRSSFYVASELRRPMSFNEYTRRFRSQFERNLKLQTR